MQNLFMPVLFRVFVLSCFRDKKQTSRVVSGGR
jgi:hypothetical protein